MNEKCVTVDSLEAALKLAAILVDQEYCVMLSREDEFYIVTFEFSVNSDRNGVVFMSREDYDEELFLHGSEEKIED